LAAKRNRYDDLIVEIFFDHYKKGDIEFKFERDEISKVATKLDIELPKNLGDLLYYYRFRHEFPDDIKQTAGKGYEWIIELAGHGKYRFKQSKISMIIPTPEIIAKYALSDEQALLAKIRYNRLVDLFLGLAAYSLQNHLRTTVKGVGQIEIDELYIGINKQGSQFVIPVQAKGGKDKIGVVQVTQDIGCCAEKFPNLICRPLAAQFMEEDKIALFELTVQDDEIRIMEEKHYVLVSSESISEEEISKYNQRFQP